MGSFSHTVEELVELYQQGTRSTTKVRDHFAEVGKMVDLGEPIRDLRVLEEKQFDFGRKNTETGFSLPEKRQ